MTTEEKAKNYDRAIERARKLKEDPQSVFYEYSPKEGDTICDYIFPELRESEGEKIRKDIIVLVKDWWDRVTKDNISTKEQMIAWLEKQGEQKPILDFKARNWYVSKVDGKIHDMTYNPTDKKELKKLTQSVTKISDKVWSEEDDKRLVNTTISFLNDYADKGYENAVECIDWLKSLKERLGGK